MSILLTRWLEIFRILSLIFLSHLGALSSGVPRAFRAERTVVLDHQPCVRKRPGLGMDPSGPSGGLSVGVETLSVSWGGGGSTRVRS